MFTVLSSSCTEYTVSSLSLITFSDLKSICLMLVQPPCSPVVTGGVDYLFLSFHVFCVFGTRMSWIILFFIVIVFSI